MLTKEITKAIKNTTPYRRLNASGRAYLLERAANLTEGASQYLAGLTSHEMVGILLLWEKEYFDLRSETLEWTPETLKALRLGYGLTQEVMGKVLGFSRGVPVSAMEGGKAPISTSTNRVLTLLSALPPRKREALISQIMEAA